MKKEESRRKDKIREKEREETKRKDRKRENRSYKEKKQAKEDEKGKRGERKRRKPSHRSKSVENSELERAKNKEDLEKLLKNSAQAEVQYASPVSTFALKFDLMKRLSLHGSFDFDNEAYEDSMHLRTINNLQFTSRQSIDDKPGNDRKIISERKLEKDSSEFQLKKEKMDAFSSSRPTLSQALFKENSDKENHIVLKSLAPIQIETSKKKERRPYCSKCSEKNTNRTTGRSRRKTPRIFSGEDIQESIVLKENKSDGSCLSGKSSKKVTFKL